MATDHFTDALLELNPWLEYPQQFGDVVAQRHLPIRPQRRATQLIAEVDRATLVIGPRQAGKSTLVWRELATYNPALIYLSGEEPSFRALAESPALFRAKLRQVLPAPSAIFIDEAQHFADAGLLVKTLVDSRPGCPVLVTGSSSFHLLARTRESLAGRANYQHLMPFSLDELAPQTGQSPAIVAHGRATAWRRHVVYGGYPRVALAASDAQAEAELRRLVRAVVLRDASDVHKVKNSQSFHKLLTLAAGQVGSLVNVTEWAALVATHRATVNDWIALLEDMHIVVTCPVYAGGKRAEVTHARKFFFVDCGLRNALVDSFADLSVRADRGALLEQWVFSELHKRAEFEARLHHWRTRAGAEVDFVLDLPHGLVGIEVKVGPADPPRLSKSVLSFIEAYAPKRFFVVHGGVSGEARVAETAVRWVSPSDFMVNLLAD